MSNANSESKPKSFSDFLIEKRSQKFLNPFPIPNREKYYFDLDNIERSWIYPFDGYCNLFISEAEQLLFNSLILFESGYFDCAFYSLRSAIEISTTIVFLSDLPQEEREKYLIAWSFAQKFPIHSKMIKEISEKGKIYVDMLKRMPGFFENSRKLLSKLNKHVHKQGLWNFYVCANQLAIKDNTQILFKLYRYFLEKCIGVVAVMRLAIDPFPVLLTDDDLFYRFPYSAAAPYNLDFTNFYIGSEIIEQYKNTNIYKTYYNSIICKEKLCKEAFSVARGKHIDSKNIDKIIQQSHLLYEADVVSTLLVRSSSKVVKVYHGNPLVEYSSDRDSNRLSFIIAKESFAECLKSPSCLNFKYDNVYISALIFNNDIYFIEHNELLTEREYISIIDYVKGNMPTHFRNEN